MKIFIGIPTHKGEISAHTSISTLSGQSANHEVQAQILGISLLAKNFNMLWINAYTRRFDVFILLHSDIGITDINSPWIDQLVDILLSTNSAVISVVSAIKNDDGVTSTALEMSKRSHHTLRRISIRELNKLPGIFYKSDVCKLFGISEQEAGALLVNTGCMAMNLHWPWFEKRWPGFRIDDKIVWSKSGEPKEFTTPEDWLNSRWMDENGFKYCATKLIRLEHYGIKPFPNYGEWGNEIDLNPETISPEDWEES